MEPTLWSTLDPGIAAHAPPRFHLLAKPSGSTCNIDCKYGFFLTKEALYPDVPCPCGRGAKFRSCHEARDARPVTAEDGR